MLKILGVGLSRTGTTSLHSAMEILGYKSIHYDNQRLNDVYFGVNKNPDFRVYGDIDAVFDIPSTYFYREILAAYPDCRAILTVRDVDGWWKSISSHINERNPLEYAEGSRKVETISRIFGIPSRRENLKAVVRSVVYGSITPNEYIYKKKYLEHIQQVKKDIPPERLLEINICAGEGWDVLCPFLGVPAPAVAFPRTNQAPARVKS